MSKHTSVETKLQQLTSETIHLSAFTGNEAYLDICAKGFWQTGQMALFDVRIFNSNAKRYVNHDKKIIHWVLDQGGFTTLVMLATGRE